jgi:ribosomal protein S18 acetylase RimI-like enzyme
MDVRIRAARLGDARQVADLCGELGYPARASDVKARLRALLRRKDQGVFVAESAAGQVCGWIQVRAGTVLAYGTRAEIAGLVVSSGTRKAGVGRKLVAKAEAWAAGLPVDKLVVSSNLVRKESHRFYPALGFQRTKTQAVYAKRPRG